MAFLVQPVMRSEHATLDEVVVLFCLSGVELVLVDSFLSSLSSIGTLMALAVLLVSVGPASLCLSSPEKLAVADLDLIVWELWSMIDELWMILEG